MTNFDYYLHNLALRFSLKFNVKNIKNDHKFRLHKYSNIVQSSRIISPTLTVFLINICDNVSTNNAQRTHNTLNGMTNVYI